MKFLCFCTRSFGEVRPRGSKDDGAADREDKAFAARVLTASHRFLKVASLRAYARDEHRQLRCNFANALHVFAFGRANDEPAVAVFVPLLCDILRNPEVQRRATDVEILKFFGAAVG